MSDELKKNQEASEEVRPEASGVSRRGFVKGSIAAVGAFIAGTAVGGWAITTYGNAKAYVTSRIGSLYDYDKAYAVKKSHENKELLALYDEFLSPGAFRPAYTEMSHRMCHTVYGKDIPAHIEHLKSTSVEETMAKTRQQMQEFLAGDPPEVQFEKANAKA